MVGCARDRIRRRRASRNRKNGARGEEVRRNDEAAAEERALGRSILCRVTPVAVMKGVDQAEVACDLPRRSNVCIGCNVATADGSEIRVVRQKVPRYKPVQRLLIVGDVQIAAGIHEPSGELESGYEVRLKADLLGRRTQARPAV